jgi:hypothetical protein
MKHARGDKVTLHHRPVEQRWLQRFPRASNAQSFFGRRHANSSGFLPVGPVELDKFADTDAGITPDKPVHAHNIQTFVLSIRREGKRRGTALAANLHHLPALKPKGAELRRAETHNTFAHILLLDTSNLESKCFCDSHDVLSSHHRK